MKKILSFGVMTMILLTGAPLLAAGNNLLWTASGTAVCENSDDQQQPRAIPDAFGGVIVAWQSYRRGEDIDIFAQRLDRQGHAIWSAGGIPICFTNNDQQNLQMTSDRSGNVFLTWSDYRGNEDFDIYIQKIDVNGARLWSTHGIAVCQAPSNQVSPRVVSDEAGGAIVVWQDARDEGGADIYAQHVDSSGTPLWSLDGIAVCAAIDQQVSPDVIGDGAGGAIIAWQDRRTGDDMDMYAQRLDISGASQWGLNGIPVCTEAGNQAGHRMIPDGSAGVILAWEDHRYGHCDVYIQRMDAGGSPLWQMDGVPICDLAGHQNDIAMAPDGSWGAILAWTDGRHGQEDIYAQRIDANGRILWQAGGEPVCAHESRQTGAQLVGDGSGGAIIAWQDYRSGSRYEIFAQRVNSYGRSLKPFGGTSVCEAFSDQTAPQIVADGGGGAIVIWRDQRGDDADIFAQRVNFNPAPDILSVSDFPNDQGRSVLVLWQPSYFDDPGSHDISYYAIWRKCPPGSMIELAGAEWDGTRPQETGQRVYRYIQRGNDSGDVVTDCWELLGSVPAAHHSRYGFVAPTPKDSSSEDAAHCWFVVSAHTAERFELWQWEPHMGYSVDDISPGRPQLRAVIPEGGGETGTFVLIWDQVRTGADGSPELGPLRYDIHCDVTSSFAPCAENRVWTTPDLSFRHTDSRILDSMSGVYYLVVAVDGSDNRSAPSNRVGGYKLSVSKER